VIDSVTSKVVLILGRFSPERKVVFDALATVVRKHNLLPVIFDFEGSTSRDVTETIKTLAGLSFRHRRHHEPEAITRNPSG
jgi:hypothetical protein